MDIAGGVQSIVHTGRGVFDNGQNGPTFIGEKGFPHIRHHFVNCRPGVFHRHELIEVGCIESPGVDHLSAMSINDTDTCARAKGLSAPLTGGDEDHLRHDIP
jgi:hypothetical protein